MDYLSIQQRKEALDNTICRAIVIFEKETETAITEITVHSLDKKCTSISTRMQTWH
jgi:hypothetical protein